VSQNSIVLLRGSLQGMEREAECEVLARTLGFTWSVESAKRVPVYTDCSVLTAPPNLPDGEYLVTFEGNFVMATRQRGHWLSHGSATRLE
jgi:hypothetical protein